ncbi:MAG: universal stress protein, partial [Pseudohongiella sp.]
MSEPQTEQGKSAMSEIQIPEMTGKVLACVDDSVYAEAVCDYAAWTAGRMNTQLSLLHVLDKNEGTTAQNLSGSLGLGAQENLMQELAELDQQRSKLEMEKGKLMLQAAMLRVEEKGIVNAESRQRHGELVDTLIELEPETRILVVGKRGADTESAHGHIGSHLESIIRALHKPILIAQQSFAPPKQIMIAYDGSATMRKGIHIVAASPLGRGIPHHVVMVGADTDVARAQLQEATDVMTKAGFEVTGAIIPGDADIALAEYQERENIDLMVMGAYGHSRIRQLILGSTTTAMIKRTKISLLVL